MKNEEIKGEKNWKWKNLLKIFIDDNPIIEELKLVKFCIEI